MKTRVLSPRQVRLIESFRIARRLSIPQLKYAMDAPFRWPVLFRALHRGTIKETTYRFLSRWIDRNFPSGTPPLDGKSAAAGDVNG